jgi:peptidoglycan/xylan/chitin deacetylase (PgdA/CDA1 family)
VSQGGQLPAILIDRYFSTLASWRVEQAFMRIVGVKPAFLRPPYGSYNDLTRRVAASRGQKLVMWDFDSGDSTGSTPAQSKQMYNDLANRHPSTVLALNHETYGMVSLCSV